MRTLIFGGVMLLVAVALLEGRRRAKRVRAGVQPSSRATERWEDEGGAVRGRPA